MTSQKVAFPNIEGRQLSAQLDLPLRGRPAGCAVFAHCFTCSKNLRAVTHISEGLGAQGIAVLRFDSTGLGRSEGSFKEWPLEDCRTCDTMETKIDHIDREIELVGPLDEDQRGRLLEIADRCPVHRTLHSDIELATALRADRNGSG